MFALISDLQTRGWPGSARQLGSFAGRVVTLEKPSARDWAGIPDEQWRAATAGMDQPCAEFLQGLRTVRFCVFRHLRIFVHLFIGTGSCRRAGSRATTSR